MKKKDLFLAVAGIILVIGLILSSSNHNKPIEKIGYAMDTQIRIVVYDNDADEKVLEGAYSEILRLDKLLSNFNEESETRKLNTEKELAVSDELLDVIKKGKEISEKTLGAYDLTVYPLTKMWHYKNIYVPSDAEIKEALIKVDYSNIEISENRVILRNNAEIDLSSIAKGYVADCIIDYLKDNGIEDALVDAGGNIKVTGSPYKDKKEGFYIGIQDPARDTGIPLGEMKIHNEAVVTSGIYERNFKKDGKTYHHIIDTKTGYPSESDVVSVSVISEDSAVADAYATAVVVMGSEKGLELIESESGLECIIIKKDNTIVLSDGVKNFEITNKDYKFAD